MAEEDVVAQYQPDAFSGAELLSIDKIPGYAARPELFLVGEFYASLASVSQ